MDIVVLGGGVVGVTSAWYLAKAGHKVTLLERRDGVALETSHANAGQISPGYASPWAAPGIPLKAAKWLLQKHALTAASLGIPTSNILIAENGSNVILSQDEMKLGEPVTAGAVMVDGLGVGDVGNVVLRDRKHLSEDGLVIIVATVDSKTGKVLAGPDLISPHSA